MTKYQLKSEDITSGALGYISPLEVQNSPQGDLVTFLYPDETGKRQLFAANMEKLWTSDIDQSIQILLNTANTNSNEKLSLEEQLRRERMRLFVQGISTYEWSSVDDTQIALIPLGSSIHLAKLTNSQTTVQIETAYSGEKGGAIDPHLAPNGKSLAFIINNDIHLCNSGGEVFRVTFEANKEGFSAGVADFVAQEEMSRYRGFWWSPDSRQIAFTCNDESKIPKYEILHQGKDDPKHAEYHRYPFAGKRNPIVRLGVLDIDQFAPDKARESYTRLFDICDANDTRFHTLQEDTGIIETEYYICRVDWWPDGSIMAQIENRNQDLLQLLRINPATGEKEILLEETSSVWINLHELCKPLPKNWIYPNLPHAPNDFYFFWGSERSGFMQLYLYKYDSLQKRTICLSPEPIGGGGNWVVESLDAIDVERQLVYMCGNYSDSRERHLVRTSFLPVPSSGAAGVQRLTAMNGWHSCTVNINHSLFFDVSCSVDQCVMFTAHQFDPTTGKILQNKIIYDAARSDRRILQSPTLLPSLVKPVFHTVRSNDNQVDLECALYLPEGVELQDYLQGKVHRSYPCIVSVYGGPHVQRVQNHWLLTADLRAQKFAQNDIIVLKCDNRGSYRRGIAFEGAIRHDMGNIEIQDQVAAVQYFVKLGLVDASRVGMFGWSYGGYMSAMSVCRAPETFCCAVAGAPVTSWDGYDTHYTERYMGRPQENVVGYSDSSVMNHVSKMRGKLLLIHGLIDENVHFRHTARLINALISARKRYELVLFPCERHSPHKVQDRMYLEDIMWEFFYKNLVEKKV